jgi:ketosteroid isomerase-like protein
MSEENVEIVRRVVEAFQKGLEHDDPAAAFDSAPLAADVEWITPPGLGLPTYRGREGFLEFMRTWTEDFEGFSIELERLIDTDDDRVIGLFHQRATGKRRAGRTANGRDLRDRGWSGGSDAELHRSDRGPRSRWAVGVRPFAYQRSWRASCEQRRLPMSE